LLVSLFLKDQLAGQAVIALSGLKLGFSKFLDRTEEIK
jgi:hypothetical protein